MRKISKIITICAAVVSLAACENPFKKNDQPSENQQQEQKDTNVAVESVSLDHETLDLYVTGSAYLRATVAPENATNKYLTWSSNDEDVAIVSATGKVTGLRAGSATIKVESQADPTKFDECRVTVSVRDDTVHVTSLTVVPTEIALDLGGMTSVKPTVTVGPENATNKAVSWSSSDTSKVVVDNEGTVIALAETTQPVVVTVASVDTPTIKQDISVTVADTRDTSVHVDSVSLPETFVIDLKNSSTANLFADVAPSNAYNKRVTWHSENSAIVSIGDSLGDTGVTLIGHSVGKTNVTATSVDDNTKFATCEVEVKDTTVNVSGVSIQVAGLVGAQTTANVEKNRTITLEAVVSPTDATNKEIEWVVPENNKLIASPGANNSLVVLGQSVTGENPVVIRAKAKADPDNMYSDIAITVIDPSQLDRFVNFSDPADYLAYKLHSADGNLRSVTNLSSDPTLSANFYRYDEVDLAKKDYKVGDQGLFHFEPVANVKLAGQSETITVSNFATHKELYLIDGSNESVVNLDDYCTCVDNDYQFNSEAEGKKFRLEITPDDSRYYVSGTIQPYEFTFSVIHAYNVDSIEELSLFDNSQSAWSSYKETHNLGSVTAEGGIVLHKDLKVSNEMIPEAFVQSESDFNTQCAKVEEDFETWALTYFGSTSLAKDAFIGSLKDYNTIFNRDTSTDEQFSLEGNFFQIDCSEVKPVYLLAPSDGPETLANGLLGDGSHSQLFGINVENSTPAEKHNVTMRNFSVKGNGELSGGILKKGGLIAFKMNSARFDIQNAIMSNTFISFMSEENGNVKADSITEMYADRITSYNSYSSMFYLFGTYKNHVTNSWLSQCGGPLVFMDEPYDGHPWFAAYMKTSMDCTNCYLMNEVMGTEPWFQGHTGSTTLVQGFVVGPGLNGGWYNTAAGANGKTIARKDENGHDVCNLIAVDVSAKHFADNDTTNLGGSFIVNNDNTQIALNMESVARDAEGYSVVDKAHAQYYVSQHYVESDSFNLIPYMFMSGAGTLGIYDGTNLNDVSALVGGGSLFTTDYVAAYLNPMSARANPADPTDPNNIYLVTGRYIGIFLGTYSK